MSNMCAALFCVNGTRMDDSVVIALSVAVAFTVVMPLLESAVLLS